MTKQTKILSGLLAGAAIGAAVALVLSSDKNEIKDKVSDWFCDLLANSKDKLDVVGELVKDQLTKVKA